MKPDAVMDESVTPLPGYCPVKDDEFMQRPGYCFHDYAPHKRDSMWSWVSLDLSCLGRGTSLFEMRVPCQCMAAQSIHELEAGKGADRDLIECLRLRVHGWDVHYPVQWQKPDKATLMRINTVDQGYSARTLCKDDWKTGMQLRHNLPGYWSRRINDGHSGCLQSC